MKNLHVIASILTIVTVLINISVALFGNTFNIPYPEVTFEIPNFFIKLIVFLYLELFISLFFSFIKYKVIGGFFDNEPPIILIVILVPVFITVITISAWTSIFNIEWIFLDKEWGYGTFWSLETMKVFLWGAVSVGIMWISGGVIKDLVDGPIMKKNPGSDKEEREEFDIELAGGFSFIIGLFLLFVIIYKFFN